MIFFTSEPVKVHTKIHYNLYLVENFIFSTETFFYRDWKNLFVRSSHLWYKIYSSEWILFNSPFWNTCHIWYMNLLVKFCCRFKFSFSLNIEVYFGSKISSRFFVCLLFFLSKYFSTFKKYMIGYTNFINNWLGM